jgi:hypothetical protein
MFFRKNFKEGSYVVSFLGWKIIQFGKVIMSWTLVSIGMLDFHQLTRQSDIDW